MAGKILVTYASKYGSTKETAESIATALRDGGLDVDVQRARDVRSLSGYTAFVLGAPLYMGLWHKEAVRFFSRHKEVLSKPSARVAVFALGPIHEDEAERKESRATLDKKLADFPWLTPMAVEVFGGRYDPDSLHFPDSLIAKLPASPLHDQPASDVRDWEAIHNWANDLARRISLEKE